MKIITLTKGYSTKVSDEDHVWLSAWKWNVMENREKELSPRPRAWRYENGRPIYMSREIMKAPKGLWVDHINGDT